MRNDRINDLLIERIPSYPLPPDNLIIDVTRACNLKCPICFTESPKKSNDLSLEKFTLLVGRYKGKRIIISGGEPTLREDLFEMIKIVRKKKNIPILATNGIKLSDYSYTLKLKKSGLEYILFSFNGFNDRIYTKINGKKLLRVKLEALKNIKKVGMKVILSVLLVKGVNDDPSEVRKILEFSLKNNSTIQEVRIRTISPFGRLSQLRDIS